MNAPRKSKPTATAITAGVHPAKPEVPSWVFKYLTLVKLAVSVAEEPVLFMHVSEVAFQTKLLPLIVPELQPAVLCANCIRINAPMPTITAKTTTP